MADPTDRNSLRETIRGAEAVMHLGAYTLHGKKNLYNRVSVQGTRDLLEACVTENVQRFVYHSTTEVGPVLEIPAREDHPARSQYEYGKSKLRAESWLESIGTGSKPQ